MQCWTGGPWGKDRVHSKSQRNVIGELNMWNRIAFEATLTLPVERERNH